MDHETRSCMAAAIDAAVEKDILMFCAADDAEPDAMTGRSDDHLSYPAYFSQKVIILGAADPTGTVWINTHKPYNFILPGCRIRQRYWDDMAAQGGEESAKRPELNGSSIATALASGLAGLLLYCVRASAVYVSNESRKGSPPRPGASDLDINDFSRLHTRAKIMEAFKHIGASSDTDAEFIRVWETFDVATKQIKVAEGKTMETKWAAVFDAVRDIVKKNNH